MRLSATLKRPRLACSTAAATRAGGEVTGSKLTPRTRGARRKRPERASRARPARCGAAVVAARSGRVHRTPRRAPSAMCCRASSAASASSSGDTECPLTSTTPTVEHSAPRSPSVMTEVPLLPPLGVVAVSGSSALLPLSVPSVAVSVAVTRYRGREPVPALVTRLRSTSRERARKNVRSGTPAAIAAVFHSLAVTPSGTAISRSATSTAS